MVTTVNPTKEAEPIEMPFAGAGADSCGPAESCTRWECTLAPLSEQNNRSVQRAATVRADATITAATRYYHAGQVHVWSSPRSASGARATHGAV